MRSLCAVSLKMIIVKQLPHFSGFWSSFTVPCTLASSEANRTSGPDPSRRRRAGSLSAPKQVISLYRVGHPSTNYSLSSNFLFVCGYFPLCPAQTAPSPTLVNVFKNGTTTLLKRHFRFGRHAKVRKVTTRPNPAEKRRTSKR